MEYRAVDETDGSFRRVSQTILGTKLTVRGRLPRVYIALWYIGITTDFGSVKHRPTRCGATRELV